MQYQFITYNMSIYENVEYSCLTLEVKNSSAVSEMRIKHFCPREPTGAVCYAYKGTLFEISVYIVYSDTCQFEMIAWGWKKNMTLIDVQEWKWEEGTFYADFSMTRVSNITGLVSFFRTEVSRKLFHRPQEEYRGTPDMTGFGFEPLDEKMWVPEFDLWTTTAVDNATWDTTTPRGRGEGLLLALHLLLPCPF
ncbi:unnamed protein product [Diatraea saccharalis]|uniref:Uncharacterized protein n=1 Tax=Diatraea saccharalis TaxID=40085 RepID=A0A9P0G3K6_9NEOP|nr:unnamed protein product [Diatraea saccharalis]